MVRIGIVEENELVREMFQTGFKMAGHQVTTYARAQECINACISAKLNGEQQPHDIVIVHINLGESIDGAEMIRRIRQFVPNNELKFIIMSGADLVDRNLLEQNLLTVPVLTLPLKPGDLLKEAKKELLRSDRAEETTTKAFARSGQGTEARA